MKSPFATLQQTETPSSLTGTVLHLGRFSIIFKLGHGEWLLPDGQVSLRSVNFAARRLLKLPELLPDRHRSFQHNQIPIQPTIESAIKPSRNHPATPPKRPSHKPLPTLFFLDQQLIQQLPNWDQACDDRFRQAVQLSLLSQHRGQGPYGLEGGQPGARGRQWIERSDGRLEPLNGIDQASLSPGDALILETPGGGAWGVERDIE